MPGTWVSSNGPRSSLGCRPKPWMSVMFSFYRRHKASAEFQASGKYCVSSASAYVPTDTAVVAGGSAQSEPPNRTPRTRRSGSKEPSTTRADGVMVLVSPTVPANTIHWKEHVQGRVLEVRFDWHRATVLAACLVPGKNSSG